METLLHNEAFVLGAMGLVIFGITQLLKLPIKFFTSKIQNERGRRIVNATILLIPFACGILGDYLYATYYLHTAYDIVTGLSYGLSAISLYGFVERFFKVKVDNPYETNEGKAVLQLVDNVTKDGKVDNNDKSAVQSFLEKMGK